MIRMLLLAAVVAIPAAALADTTTTTGGALFTEKQAREHLAHLGYTGISDLTRDENGVWRGAAVKDGAARTVAVDLKGALKR